jgi:hypothetical protein
MAIKDILKKGDKVDGAFLKQNINLNIKWGEIDDAKF